MILLDTHVLIWLALEPSQAIKEGKQRDSEASS